MSIVYYVMRSIFESYYIAIDTFEILYVNTFVPLIWVWIYTTNLLRTNVSFRYQNVFSLTVQGQVSRH